MSAPAGQAPATSQTDDASDAIERALTRRGFLRGAALAGGGIAAATLAACTPIATPGWTYGPTLNPSASGAPVPTAAGSAAPSAAASAAASGSPAPSGNIPTGWTQHDIDARAVVRRYIGNLAPALQGIYGDKVFGYLADMLAVSENYPELQKKPSFAQVPNLVLTDATAPLTATVEGGVKVFRLTIDEIDQKIDEMKPTIAALGFNKQWPG